MGEMNGHRVRRESNDAGNTAPRKEEQNALKVQSRTHEVVTPQLTLLNLIGALEEGYRSVRVDLDVATSVHYTQFVGRNKIPIELTDSYDIEYGVWANVTRQRYVYPKPSLQRNVISYDDYFTAILSIYDYRIAETHKIVREVTKKRVGDTSIVDPNKLGFQLDDIVGGQTAEQHLTALIDQLCVSEASADRSHVRTNASGYARIATIIAAFNDDSATTSLRTLCPDRQMGEMKGHPFDDPDNRRLCSARNN